MRQVTPEVLTYEIPEGVTYILCLFIFLGVFEWEKYILFCKEGGMSLLTQASPFSSNEVKPEKMKANMTTAFKRIQNEQLNNNTIITNSSDLGDALANNNLRTSKIEQQIMSKTQPSNDGDRLADFKLSDTPPPPPPPPPPPIQNQFVRTPVSYSKNNGSSFSQSYNSTTPYYQGLTAKGPALSHTSPQLMEKLNYMIHLLEEQQKEPTQNILEEFALYGLLGIFMIYIVDSFARVGKYTR